jgi:phage gp46-like protein
MFDIELDKPTGDWKFSPNLDIKSVKSDEDVVGQRIWTRLRIGRGWINDPTDGLLGSRLRSLGTRIPRNRALIEIPLYIEEALAPMPDVRILDITLSELPDDQSVWAHISYSVTDPGDPRPIPAQTTQTLNVEIRLQ